MNNKLIRRTFLVGTLVVFTLSMLQLSAGYQKDRELSYNVNNTEKTQLSTISPVYSFFESLSLNKNGKEVNKIRPEVIPGGQSIGVTLQTKGVLVVGYAPISGQNGKQSYPAKESGIEIGDIILTIDGKKALNDFQVAQEIDKKCQDNQTIELEIKHNDAIQKKKIRPVYCSETGRYRIGLFIRDEAAGVGTMTFIEPKTKIFGALGHVITDIDTNDQIELSQGKIVESTIYAIEKGLKGDPGEKIGTFMLDSRFSGVINKNSDSGIFGVYEGSVNNPFYTEAIPIAWKSEIKVGPAKIYTVLKDNTIEEFDISIEKIMKYRADNKNMIIRVTDQKLLEKSGGIVQGMSGSPIVQDGKIVGAVTHVFVNDATRGYGIFIEKMLEESEILSKAAVAPLGGFFLFIRKYK
ncbi:SpoIVB peptidase [Dehalobacter sp. DCM]|uniref:SpoIVB peptidase n=1 Tax=Dehalobacter sp. DCM TaxID=2907827 RepID=UPI0030813A60|nr:SpoIVB peptidase [Dehalobacter sp. DCM]